MTGNYRLTWFINCANTDTGEHFERVLTLNLANLKPEDRQQIEQVLATGNKQGIVKFRHLFTEVPGGREGAAAARAGEDCDGFDTFVLPFYQEDQNGQPLGRTDFVAAKRGTANLVVMGDPTGPLRIGPVEMARQEEWTMEKSNDMAHFLEVTNALATSDWVRSRTSFKYTQNPDGTQKILDFQHPGLFNLTSVMVFIRQLFARRDRLFQKVMEAYERHANEPIKVVWVKYEFDQFNHMLDSTVFPFKNLGLTGNELLELFFYGFGLIHRWNPDTARRFRESKDTHGREVLVMEFQSTCQHLYAHAHTAAHVIRQDFSHWVKTGKAVPPDRVSIAELLP